MTATQALHGYSTRVADLDHDCEAILHAWADGLQQDGRPREKLEWYYRHNVEQAPLVVFLLHGTSSSPVGVATLAPRGVMHGGQLVMAGLLVDFVVAPEHRNFFPALFLQRELRRHGEQRFAILYGVPNRHSEAIVKRLGYRRLGNMTRYAIVLRSRSYLACHLPAPLAGLLAMVADPMRHWYDRLRDRAKPARPLEWLAHPDGRFDALFENCARAGTVMGARTARYLQWRLVDGLGGAHRFAVVPGEDGGLLAYAACLESPSTLAVNDFLVDPAHHGAAHALWSGLKADAYTRGFPSLSVECLAPQPILASIDAAGLVARDGVPVYVAGGEGNSWFVTPADEDM